MTANGDVDLRPVLVASFYVIYLRCVSNDNIFSYHIYKLSFLNFLLGRQPNGPGQFMFGTIEWEQKTSWMEGVNTQDISLVKAVNNMDISSQQEKCFDEKSQKRKSEKKTRPSLQKNEFHELNGRR